MSILSNTISSFLPSQVPAYIAGSYPNFVALLQQYFEFLENTTYNGTVYQIRNLLNYKEIDSTTTEFYQYFQDEFLPYFPQDISLDLVKLLKIATQFYQSKGSEQSLEFLFRVLYGLDSEIYYPKNNILRLSAGQWDLPQSFKISFNDISLDYDIQNLVGRQATGSESYATCVIESVDLAIDPTLGLEILEIFVSNIVGEFDPGENLIVNAGTYSNGTAIVFSEPIIGSLSEIDVNPAYPGLSYVGTTYYSNGTIDYPGNPVSIIGGLGNTSLDIQAVAYVQNVTSGSITGITVDNGGYGFSLYPNTIVSIVGGGGTGANVTVVGVDTENQVTLILNSDSIAYKANIEVGNSDYQFTNIANANLDTVIQEALTYYSVNIAPLTSLSVISGGQNYTSNPTLNLRSMFDSDFSSNLYSDYIATPTLANFNNWQDARPNIGDLGIIAAVSISLGGSDYSNTTDQIVVDSEVGLGAIFDFITNDSGAITSVIVFDGGTGYYNMTTVTMPNLLIVNSTNVQNSSAGSGASLLAIGYNQDDILTLSVSQLGEIETITLTNRGFNYISTPNVSLRNQDVVIEAISNNDLYYQTDLIYQGTNANSTTFLAYVDIYDKPNNILRLYNYTGSINLSQNLIGANFNSTPLSANVYGNGKAKANAQFLGGLIDYPGFWIGTSGFLSADQRFQANSEYHNYSYLIKVEKALAAYQDTVKNIVHPAGTQMVALCTITSIESQSPMVNTATIEISNTTNMTGNVNVDAFGNGLVIGVDTEFVGNVNIGDLFTINTGGINQQTKVVSNVINSTALLLESNTMYFASETLITNTGSNTVIISDSNSALVVNDVIMTNISGNVQTSIIQVAISANTFNVNTVFESNTSNAYFVVYPTMNNQTYNVFTSG